MAIYIKTENPKELLEKIKDKSNVLIDPDWKVDENGDFSNKYDYIHSSCLRPRIMPKNLVMGLIGRKNKIDTYSYFHAEFCYFVLKWFDKDIISIRITPQKVEGIDNFNYEMD